MLIVLAVIVVAYIGFSAFMTAREQAQFEANDPSVKAFSVSSKDVVSIGWIYNGEELLFEREGNTNNWFLVEDPNFPLDQLAPKYVLYQIDEIIAAQAITNVTNLSEYGLDDPISVITIKDKQGEVTTLTIGDQNAVSEDYYMYMNDDTATVYMVGDRLIERISNGLDDILDIEEIELNESVSMLALYTNGGVTMLSMDTDNGSWTLNESISVDPQKVNEIITYLMAIQWTECVDYYAEDAELEAFGLGENASHVMASYLPENSKDGEPAVFELVYSQPQEGAEFAYARLGDSRMVYSVDSRFAAVMEYLFSTVTPGN